MRIIIAIQISMASFLFTSSSMAASNDELREPFPVSLDRLRDRANQALGEDLVVVTDKPDPPPGGSLHDYWSLSPYHWPDPNSDGGMPYINRDGEVNPESESERFDRLRLFKMSDVVRACSLGYSAMRDERYAECAARWVRSWFIEHETRMNPSLDFAQHIPGKTAGSPAGIIRGMIFLEVNECLQHLSGSPHWTEEDTKGWKAWTAAYLDWLLTSELGQLEEKAFNNHGTWHDVQVSTFALLHGREELVRQRLALAKSRRIQRQIKPDGRQPLELMRTKSWDYSVMNLLGMARLAECGMPLGEKLWEFETPQGAGMRKALDYLLPFALGEEIWTGKHIRDFDGRSLYPVVHAAARALGDARYDAAMAKLGGDHAANLEENLRDRLHESKP